MTKCCVGCGQPVRPDLQHFWWPMGGGQFAVAHWRCAEKAVEVLEETTGEEFSAVPCEWVKREVKSEVVG